MTSVIAPATAGSASARVAPAQPQQNGAGLPAASSSLDRSDAIPALHERRDTAPCPFQPQHQQQQQFSPLSKLNSVAATDGGGGSLTKLRTVRSPAANSTTSILGGGTGKSVKASSVSGVLRDWATSVGLPPAAVDEAVVGDKEPPVAAAGLLLSVMDHHEPNEHQQHQQPHGPASSKETRRLEESLSMILTMLIGACRAEAAAASAEAAAEPTTTMTSLSALPAKYLDPSPTAADGQPLIMARRPVPHHQQRRNSGCVLLGVPTDQTLPIGLRSVDSGEFHPQPIQANQASLTEDGAAGHGPETSTHRRYPSGNGIVVAAAAARPPRMAGLRAAASTSAADSSIATQHFRLPSNGLLSSFITDGSASLATPSGRGRQATVVTNQSELRHSANDSTTELNQYVFVDTIGHGTQGEVLLAMDTQTNELRAVKVVPRPAFRPSAAGRALNLARARRWEDLQREVAIMKRVRHRNVVTLHEVIDDPARDSMYLVMQYIEKGPLARLDAHGCIEKPIEPLLLAEYGVQICRGLSYLHRRGIVHRDVKPENILLGHNSQVYLADFGMAEVFEDFSAASTSGVVQLVHGGVSHAVQGTRGTAVFLAPELLKVQEIAASTSTSTGKTCSPAFAGSATTNGGAGAADATAAVGVDGEAVDVWALGITFYVLLYGKLPWPFDDVRDLFANIQTAAITLAPLSANVAPTTCSSAAGSPMGASDHSNGARRSGACDTRRAKQNGGRSVVVDSIASDSDDDGDCALHDLLLRNCGALAASDAAAAAAAPKLGDLAGFLSGGVPVVEAEAIESTLAAPAGSPKYLNLSGTARVSSVGDDDSGSRSTMVPDVPWADGVDHVWRRVLMGMLQHNPSRRMKLAEVRRYLNLLRRRDDTRFDAAAVADAEVSTAITRLRTG